MDKVDSEELAKKLHEWYLEASKMIGAEGYNLEAQKDYSDLTEEQRLLDKFIAGKILEFLKINR